MFLIHKKPSFYLLLSRTAHSNLFSSHHSLPPWILQRFSTLTAQNPPPKPGFMAEYLINSVGYPSDQAIKASKSLTHIKSPSKPDAVLQFFRECGLSEAQLRTLISSQPTILTADVEKTLKPKFRLLQEMGFSQSVLTQLVSCHPQALRSRDLRPKIELLRPLFADDVGLLNAIARNRNLRNRHFLTCSYAKRIIPNIALLRECRMPDRQFKKMMQTSPWLISCRPEMIRDKAKMAEEWGASTDSDMFWRLLQALLSFTKATLDAKFKLLKELGWSEVDITAAFRSCPTLLHQSEKNVRDKMSFFTKEAGCELSYVACRPSLLMYSLEGRLVPRHSVLRFLKSKGLFQGQQGFLCAMISSEEKFVERFVRPYECKIPGLREAYVAASAGLTSKKTTKS